MTLCMIEVHVDDLDKNRTGQDEDYGGNDKGSLKILIYPHPFF